MAFAHPLLERAAHLPRDTRDTLFHLVVIAWTVAPHLLHLPVWCGVMSAALLLWRARLSLTGGALPRRWVVSVLLALAAGLTLWTEHTLLGKEAEEEHHQRVTPGAQFQRLQCHQRHQQRDAGLFAQQRVLGPQRQPSSQRQQHADYPAAGQCAAGQ